MPLWEENFGSTTQFWKEIGAVPKEREVDQELEKASQGEPENHNQKHVESQEDMET